MKLVLVCMPGAYLLRPVSSLYAFALLIQLVQLILLNDLFHGLGIGH